MHRIRGLFFHTYLFTLLVFSALSLFVFSNTISAGPVPDTGQTHSYTETFGEDSDYIINPPSYTKLDAQGNELPDTATSWAMVRDNVTCLIWEVKTDDGSIHDKNNTYNWNDAQDVFITTLNNTNFGGFSDWRMPTVKELSSIVNSGRYAPTISTDFFPNTMSSYYWTSTADAYNSSYAWRVGFYWGSVYDYYRTSSYYVRAVRSGQSSNRFIVNGDGTVTDTETGLMWQQATAGSMNWESALTYCESLTLAGYDDWRLPDRNELQSIVDYLMYNPAIDTTVFPNTMSSSYWSSTTDTYNPDGAWRVLFFGGSVGGDYKSFSCYVRAVRSGQSVSFGDLFIWITDEGSGAKVVEADVRLEDINYVNGPVSGVTDQDGRVGFPDLPFDDYRIVIEAEGYLPHTDTIIIDLPCAQEIQYSLIPCYTYYKDMDQDGYGQDKDSQCLTAPDPASGYTVLLPGDCDDSDASIHPDTTEQCDGIDNNCNSDIDEGCPSAILTGRVLNLHTGQPVSNVRISIKDGSSYRTDADGEYIISGIAPGAQEIKFQKRGYSATVLKRIFFTNDRTLVIDVGMHRRPQ